MYMISYDERECHLEASLGGYVARHEAAVFVANLSESIERARHVDALTVDTSRVTRFDDGALALVGQLADRFPQISKVRVVTGTEEQAIELTSRGLQHVLEGRVVYHSASA